MFFMLCALFANFRVTPALSAVADITPKGEHGLRHVETCQRGFYATLSIVAAVGSKYGLGITSGLIVQGPGPLRRPKMHFRSVFRRNLPIERVFDSEFFRRYLGIICFIAEPCWLVTRIVSWVWKRRVSDGEVPVRFSGLSVCSSTHLFTISVIWLGGSPILISMTYSVELLQFYLDIRSRLVVDGLYGTHFTNTSGLIHRKRVFFSGKVVGLPTREPRGFIARVYASDPGASLRGSGTGIVGGVYWDETRDTYIAIDRSSDPDCSV
uniref:Uncharacterized protein n=1 Tax=Ananas comosus var. bracteatus TaxID=296719 RepID=A0A6V7P594_ANACO|nr:unnamed protein product [Ananas comosus var. bracteatus]